jgi:hypothetical protein
MMDRMERLDQTSVRALRALLANQPVTPAKVTFAWTIAAGAALARNARVTWDGSGVLRLTAVSDQWRAAIVRAKPLLVDRLASLLGAGIVRTIVVDTDAREPAGASRKRHA